MKFLVPCVAKYQKIFISLQWKIFLKNYNAMKKVVNACLGGRNYTLEEDAFERLGRYLEHFKLRLTVPESQKAEVMEEIEGRMAELFTQEVGTSGRVVSLEMVNRVAATLGMPDGSSDDEAEYIWKELTAWFAVHGEAIYGTRPWKTIGEGDSFLDFKDFQEDGITWKPDDVRFTRKGNTVFAFLMGAVPGQGAVLRSFNEGERVRAVRLLGVGEAQFVHRFGVLTVQMPERLPTEYVPCLAIELE